MPFLHVLSKRNTLVIDMAVARWLCAYEAVQAARVVVVTLCACVCVCLFCLFAAMMMRPARYGVRRGVWCGSWG